MGPEKFCDPCQVVTTRINNHCKTPPSNPLETGHTVYMDLLPPISSISLTPATTFKCYLWLVLYIQDMSTFEVSRITHLTQLLHL